MENSWGWCEQKILVFWFRLLPYKTRPNSKIWIPVITGPPGGKTKLILDLGLVSEAPWSTLGGGANKKFWFFGLEIYFFFLAWFSEDIAPGGYTEACSSLRPK